jgi:hypothetical protein
MQMQVKQTQFPLGSLIDLSNMVFDYTDTYSTTVFSREPVKLEDFLRFMFNTNPAWVNVLVKIREILVKPFGLITDAGKFPAAISITKEAKISIFDIVEVTNDDILLYMHDKHLDAWFSVLLRGLPFRQEITFSTAVKYHNLLGRIYFFFIKPFHKLIIKSTLRQYANNNNE